MLLNMKKGPSGFQGVQGEQGDSGGPSSMLVTPHDSTERGEQVTERTAPPPPGKAGITTACGRDLTETPGCAEQVTNQVSQVGRLHERLPGHTGARGAKPHTQRPAGGRQCNALPCGWPRSLATAFAERGASHGPQWALHPGHVAGTQAVPSPQTCA